MLLSLWLTLAAAEAATAAVTVAEEAVVVATVVTEAIEAPVFSKKVPAMIFPSYFLYKLKTDEI